MKVQINERYEITTDHPASHYGAGVLVDNNGISYGTSDFIPTNLKKMFCADIQVEAGYMVESAIRNLTVASARTEYTHAEVEQARAYLSQDPSGRFSLPPFEQLQREWERAKKDNDSENSL